MKQILFLIIASQPFFALTQSRTSIDLVTGIDISYRKLVPDNSGTSKWVADSRDTSEIPRIGFRGGINLNIKLGKKLLLKSGVRYMSNGYSGKKKTGLKYESEYDPISGGYTKDESLPHEIQFKYNYRFLEIPLGVRYVFYDKKLSCFTELGFTTAYYINGKSKQITDVVIIGAVSKNNNFLDLHFNGYLSLGLQRELNESMQVFIQPIFRYAISPLSNAAIAEHLYSAGAEFGLRYYIGKK